MTKSYSFALPLTTVAAYPKTFTAGKLLGDKWYFAFVETGTDKNFQSYYFQDKCLTRDGGKQCTLCSPGFYINDTFGYNLCQDIPAGYSYSAPISMVACLASPYCSDCQADYLTCVQGSGYVAPSWCFVDNADGSCQTSATMPQRFGGNPTTQLKVACSDPNCLTCFANYAECTLCDQAANYFLLTGPKTCIHKNSIAARFGPNFSNNHVMSCQSANCLDCSDTYLECKACDTAASYYLDTVAKTCVYVTSIASRYGANTATGIIVSCSDPNCLLCQASYTTCTGCDTAAQYYLNPNTSTCVAYADIPVMIGINSGQLLPCTQPHCTLCKDNNAQCTLCDYANDWYIQVSTYSCLANSTMTGIGPNSCMHTAVNCQETGCYELQSGLPGLCGLQYCLEAYYFNTTSTTCPFVLFCSA
jgi:hypothetical protein